MRKVFLGTPPPTISEWIIEHSPYVPHDKLKFAVKTNADYKKSGIYSATRDDISKPIVIDWGDGTVEQVDGEISQKVHEYASAGTFNVIVQNIKSYTANSDDGDWCFNQSNNSYTLCDPIRFPDQISCIAQHCFNSCNKINSISIPHNVLLIDRYAFNGCNISNVEFGDGVLSIADSAFLANSNLKNANIPDCTTYIGDGVFNDCNALSSISIGANVQHFGSSMFEYCNNLESIYVQPSNQHFKSDGSLMLTKDGTGFVACIQTSADMVIPSTVKCFPDSSFAYNQALTSIVMPSSVDQMGAYLFVECTALVNVVLPTNITSIQDSTFSQCMSLASISIPSAVEYIGDISFYQCINLSSIDLPYAVETIGQEAFANCFKLSSISCPATSIGYNTFSYCVSIGSATFTALDAGTVQTLITERGIFEGINLILDPEGQSAEPYDKTVHITCTDTEFDAVFYADGSIEFIEENGGTND